MELGYVVDNTQSAKELKTIFELTERIKYLFGFRKGRQVLKQALEGKLIVLLFNQPSTRTRLKFELAGESLGAKVSVINEITHTSVVKGENWYNTLRTFSEEGVDILTIRHPQNFVPQKLARLCDEHGFKIKVVSGGDGNNLHPTQGIADTYTIYEHFKERLGKKKLKVVIGADLMNARVAHSLVQCLAHYPGIDLTLVSWPEAKCLMPRKYLTDFVASHHRPHEVEKLPEGEKFDVIYWFRYQVEHGPDDQEERVAMQKQYNQDFRITPEFLNASLKEDGILLHPGPRTEEIDIKIDLDPRVKDGEQMRNGKFVSMALFLMMLNPDFHIY